MTEQEIDLNSDVKQDWEERLKSLSSLNGLKVYITLHDDIRDGLTDEEFNRLVYTLGIVKKSAMAQAYGMLKGVLKYSSVARTSEEWLAHAISESSDLQNYLWFLSGQMQSDKELLG